MSFLTQFESLMLQRGVTLEALADRMSMSVPVMSSALVGMDSDASSALAALATAMEAEWILVPKEHVRELRRLLERDGTAPDYSALSAAELFLRSISDGHRP
ncbi:transcriptional regulator [Caballeronia sp. J97]|uniref:transcriptional regulator n=1 Tax=Caballeronia sp. J97 TaxID=2805429 RepID=UPI002AB24FC5|nr:transcriptional regulator [Caballeronia sp. J97]